MKMLSAAVHLSNRESVERAEVKSTNSWASSQDSWATTHDPLLNEIPQNFVGNTAAKREMFEQHIHSRSFPSVWSTTGDPALQLIESIKRELKKFDRFDD